VAHAGDAGTPDPRCTDLSPGVVRERLSHVFWIGGGSGSAKTTVARRLADRYGMRVYDTDAAMPGHVRRLPPDEAPYLAGFAAMDMDERWVSRSPREMLDTFHWFRGEGFELIIADLLESPADRPVVAEGFRLLPELVHPLLADLNRAVWLLPDPRFREMVFEGRGGERWGFLARTSDPRRALRNLLERDALFTDRLAAQVRERGLHGLTVDASISEDELVRKVAAVFGLEDDAPG